MIDNKRKDYRDSVNDMGKREFTLEKMIEFGFWPKGLPTPLERGANETAQQYEERVLLNKKLQENGNSLKELEMKKKDLAFKIGSLVREQKELDDMEKARAEVARTIMLESKERRLQRKLQRENQKREKSEAWDKKRSEEIVFVGRGFSGMMSHKETNIEKLGKLGLPVIESDKELAQFLEIDYKKLRGITYHRDVVRWDNYYRFQVEKKRGGVRNIASPKKILKKSQRKILEDILYMIPASNEAHGFIKERSVVTSADKHSYGTKLLINMDIKDFFNTITFKRVLGMYMGLGYSGYISTLLAMICTYCMREEMEIKGEKVYVRYGDRVLPQGAPTSPMITNIICRRLDSRMLGAAKSFGYEYSRYADDMSFSLKEASMEKNTGAFCHLVEKILSEEGFGVNRKKTKFLRESSRQIVTGVTVNNGVSGVPKKWVKRLRAAIHTAEIQKSQGELSSNTRDEISGKISWLSSVNYERYEKIISQGRNVLKEE